MLNLFFEKDSILKYETKNVGGDARHHAGPSIFIFAFNYHEK